MLYALRNPGNQFIDETVRTNQDAAWDAAMQWMDMQDPLWQYHDRCCHCNELARTWMIDHRYPVVRVRLVPF